MCAVLQLPVEDATSCGFKYCAPYLAPYNATTTCCAEVKLATATQLDMKRMLMSSPTGKLWLKMVYATTVLCFAAPWLPLLLRFCKGRQVLAQGQLLATFGPNNGLELPPVPPTQT